MNFEENLKKEIENGDYRNEAEDEYIKMIEEDATKSKFLKVAMGSLYILLLVFSLYIV